MTTMMIAEVYEAFVAAGTPIDKARSASQAIADYESRFNKIDQSLAEIRAQLMVLKWMLGLVLLVTVIPVLQKLFAG